MARNDWDPHLCVQSTTDTARLHDLQYSVRHFIQFHWYSHSHESECLPWTLAGPTPNHLIQKYGMGFFD